MSKPTRSIRHRLVGIILLGLLPPLGGSVALFAAQDVRAIQREILNEDVLVTSMVAEYSAADVAFEDRAQSVKTLASLARQRDILFAAVYNAAGGRFSYYARPDVSVDTIPTQIVAPFGASAKISDGYIDVFQPIEKDWIHYGTVHLRATTAPLDIRTRAYFWSVLVAALCIIAVSIAFAVVLQRVISRPILNLAEVARRIAEHGDYSVRASGVGDDELGVLAGALNVMLAEIERRQKETAEAIQLRDDFLSIASHELRTPLTSFRLTVERLKRQARLPGGNGASLEKVRSSLAMMDRQVQRLESLAGKLLDVTRIRAGSLLLEREDFDLAALVRDVVDRFGDELARAGCMAPNVAGAAVVGRWDRLRIDQVVTNLVSNIIRYAAGKPIDIVVEEVGDRARVIVSDHGTGISDEAKERIFNRFERAVSPAHFGGLGLGLYISQQIVLAHGGTLTVSDTPGGGATFTIDLPR